MLLLVTLNVITKSITPVIRGEGGKCVLTMRMSEMTGNIVSVSTILQLPLRIRSRVKLDVFWSLHVTESGNKGFLY